MLHHMYTWKFQFSIISDISQVYTVSSLVEQTTPTSQVLVDVDASVSGHLEMLLESFGHLEENFGWDIMGI